MDDVFMLYEGDPCNYDRGARILDLQEENEYLRKQMRNNKNNDDDDWFMTLLKIIVLIAGCLGIAGMIKSFFM